MTVVIEQTIEDKTERRKTNNFHKKEKQPTKQEKRERSKVWRVDK